MTAEGKSETQLPRWAAWSRELQSIAQTGLHYTRDDFDRDRFARLREIAAEIASTHSTMTEPRDGPDALARLMVLGSGYPTPQVDVRAYVENDEGQVLFVRGRGEVTWSLPGGWADPGDGPRHTAERETLEESGYVVRAHRLLALWKWERWFPHVSTTGVWKCAIACSVISGAPAASRETDEAGWFDPHDSPDLSLPRMTPEGLQALITLASVPDGPAQFD